VKKNTATGATGGVGIGVLVVWLVGFAGLEMTAEVGAIIGGLATGAGAAVAAYGLTGIVKRILWGARKSK